MEMSSTDMMTHLRLKYFFFNQLTEAIDKAFEKNENIAVLMFDIDFFKKVNDTYGHDAGDEVLKFVAGELKELMGGRGHNDVQRASRPGHSDIQQNFPEVIFQSINIDQDNHRAFQALEGMDRAEQNLALPVCAVLRNHKREGSQPVSDRIFVFGWGQ